MTDITTTLEQARGGDTGAFAQIVRQYQSLVSGVLFNATGDFHKSEDIAQETFLVAWQKLGELREPSHLAAWLCTIARNLAHRSHRKPTLSTVPLSEETPTALASTAPAPDAELLRREQSEFVWSAIGEIDETYRETLVLYYRSGQSVREIADAMESTEEAVRQRLVRARKSLKAKMEEMIGNILTDTAPNEMFTTTVMAAVGATMLTTTVGCGTVAATATGGKTLGSATVWSVIFPTAILGAIFGWFATFVFGSFWASVRNAPTLRSRRCQVYHIFWLFQYFWLFNIALILGWYGSMLGAGYLGLICDTMPKNVFFIFPASLFVLVLLLVLYLQDRKKRRIAESDLGLPGLHEESYTYPQVEKRFFDSLITNALLALTLLTFFVIFTTIDGGALLGRVEKNLIGGVGIKLDSNDGYIVVREVAKGSPADKSGKLYPKDKILGVGEGKDGKIESIIGFSVPEAVALVRGPQGTVVRLDILPGGKEPSQIIDIVRDEVRFTNTNNVFALCSFFTLFILALAAVCTVIYYPLGRYFLEICRTKQTFLAAPPIIDKPFDTMFKDANVLSPFLFKQKTTKKTYIATFFYWGGFALCFTFAFLQYSWDKHPISLGICVALLAIVCCVYAVLYRRANNQNDIWLPNVLFVPCLAGIFLLLEYIELGGIYSFGVVYSLAVSGKADVSAIHAFTLTMIVMAILLTPLGLVFWYKAWREERDDAKTDRKALLREAISRYNPATMIADEPEVAAKPFPRHWIWIIGLYAAAIVVLWCAGVLIF